MNFKRLIFIACLVVLQSCFSTIPTSPDEIKPGSVKVNIPENSFKILPNGLTVYFQNRKELPLVSGSLFIPKGSANGSCGVPGLGSVTVSQMREGGTNKMSPDQVDEFLDSRAASIEFSQGEDFSTFSFTSLSSDFTDVFKTFSELIFYPRFDEKRLELSKKLLNEEITRRKDDPETMATLAFSSIIYGESSRWYEPIDTKSLIKINKKKIEEYHKSFLLPEGTFLILSGNLEESTALSEIEKYFGNWIGQKKSCDLSIKSNGNEKSNLKPGIYFLNRDFAQSTLVMGNIGPTLKELDVYSMNIFNRVFGSGSFDSVLFKEIRDKRGLAYGVSGGLASTPNRGLFSVSLATRSNAISDSILGIETVINDLKEKGFADVDIEGAIKSSKQSFVFKFANPDFAITRPAILKLSGYPSDYDKSFLDKISEVKGKIVKDFFNSVNPLENMTIVVVGKVDIQDLKGKLGNKYRYCELKFNELPEVKDCTEPVFSSESGV
jgi:zinc protease